jgi:hypothetical protein
LAITGRGKFSRGAAGRLRVFTLHVLMRWWWFAPGRILNHLLIGTYRDSILAIMDSSASTALQGCVSSLRTSMQLLESSINILDTGVHDYPRLSKVLQTTRVRSYINPTKQKPQEQTSHNSTALRTSLRTLPPNSPTNPPLLPRTRTQRPALARRIAPRQNVPSRAVAAR